MNKEIPLKIRLFTSVLCICVISTVTINIQVVTADCAENKTPMFLEILQALLFLNDGIVSNTDKFVWKTQPCSYLEAWNVTTIERNWEASPTHQYLYQELPDASLVPPPSGMRSAVPLGGISTGSIELRADGTFHEWTIINQTPASAAKIQIFDEAVFGIWTQTKPQNNVKPNAKYESSFAEAAHKMKKNYFEETANWKTSLPKNTAFLLQTHLSDSSFPGVQKIRYQGSYPVTRLEILDERLPVKVVLYGYSTYKVNDMDYSATPGILFTAVVTNPSKTDTVDVSLLLNMPLGMEKMTTRQHPADKSKYQNTNSHLAEFSSSSAEECFDYCNQYTGCQTWNFIVSKGSCTLDSSVKLNTFDEDSVSGLKGFWVNEEINSNISCVTLIREGNLGPHGNISVCPNSDSHEKKMSFGVADNIADIWNDFEEHGYLTNNLSEKNSNIHGAATINMTLAPGQTDHMSIVLAWHYPHRDFVGAIKGNHYAKLFPDSNAVAKKLSEEKEDIIRNIFSVHRSLQSSSIPTFLQDLYINSLSHIRSAMWFANGLWRQWEANDCTNMDSVHNDGERHIPYIMIFPNSTRNKMYGWARSQLENGMIPEQLRCNPSGPFTDIDVPCGRVMSDVSSMFIVYLLELYQLAGDKTILTELWPYAVRAAKWHLNITARYGLPEHLQNTYDVLGLNAYTFSTYNSAFHLLAMRAAETLATIVGDTALAQICHEAFDRGQKAMDMYLWNEKEQQYDAYRDITGVGNNQQQSTRFAKGHWFNVPRDRGAPSGAIMTDSFYAQVLAFTFGLGPLVNSTRLASHLQAELKKNDSPYGMLVMTGRYPYPGPFTDNAVWMMGNPNWATINLHLGHDPDDCIAVAKKSLDIWRSSLNDQWNVAGILGGLGYEAEGQPYITSHYGYYMSSWHILFALSGQQADIPKGRLTFNPKVRKGSEFEFPVLLPGIHGKITGKLVQGNLTYSLDLQHGTLHLRQLAVYNSFHPDVFIAITPSKGVTWQHKDM